ncbi:hypothetical protein Emag_001360 [Eimeria magna]
MRNQDPPLNWTTVVRRGRGMRGPQMPTRRGVLRVPEPRPPPTVPSNAPSFEQWEAHWPVLASGGESQAAGEGDDRPDESTQQQRGESSRSALLQASSASAVQTLEAGQDADTCGTIKFPLSYICDDDFESCVDQTSGASALDSSYRQRRIRMEPPLFAQGHEVASPNLQPKAKPEERGTDQMPSELATRLAARNDFRRLILEVEEALEEKKQIDRTSKELLLKRYEAASRIKQLEQQRLQDELNQPQESGETTGSPCPGYGHESRVDQPQQHAGVGAIGNLLSQAHIQTQALMQTLPQLLRRLRHAINKSVIFVDPATYQDALHMEEELEKAVAEFRQTQRSSRNAAGGPSQQATSRRGHREQQQDVQSAASSGGDQFSRSTHQRHANQNQGGDEQHRRAHLQQPYDRSAAYYTGSRGYPDPRLQAAYRNGSRVIGEDIFVPAQQNEPPDMRAIFWESVARARGNDAPEPRAKYALYRAPPHEQQHAGHEPITGQVPSSQPASIWEMPLFNRPSHHQPADEIRNQAHLSQNFGVNDSERQQQQLPHHLTPVHFGTVEYQQSCHQIAGGTSREQPQGTRLQRTSKKTEESYSFQSEKQQATLIDQLNFLSGQSSDPLQEQQDEDPELEEWHEKWHEDPPPILPIQLRHNENSWISRNPQEAPELIQEQPLSAATLPAHTAGSESQLDDASYKSMPSALVNPQLRLHEVLKNQLVLPLREDSNSPPHPLKWSSEWPLENEAEKEEKPLQFKSLKRQSTCLDANGYVPFAEWYSNYFPEWACAFPAKEEATACCEAMPLDRLSMTDTQPQEADEPDSPHADSRCKALCPWGSDEGTKERGPLEKLRDLIYRRLCSEEAEEADAPGGLEWLKRLQSHTEPFSFFGPSLCEQTIPSPPKHKASKLRNYPPSAILEKHPFFQPLEAQMRGANSAREPLIAGAAAAQRIVGDGTKSTAKLIIECLVFIANNYRRTPKK